MKKQKIVNGKVILGIIALLLAIAIFYPYEEYTMLNFSIKNTSEKLTGSLYLNGEYIGDLKGGQYKLNNYSGKTEELELRTIREEVEYSFLFDLDWDIEDYSEMGYVITSDEFNEWYEVIPDSFSFNAGNHWTKMPLYFYINSSCLGFQAVQFKQAFAKIQNLTSNKTIFIEVNNSSSADILLSCKLLPDCYNYTYDTEDINDYFYWVTEWEEICPHSLGEWQITQRKGNRILKAEIEQIGLMGFSETRNQLVSGYSVSSCGLSSEIYKILKIMGYEDSYEGILTPSNNYENGYGINGKADHSSLCYDKSELDEEIITNLKETYSK